jgi:predicted XRE-type DNA-binding protein
LTALLKDRGLKQAKAADLLGIKQPDVLKMLRGDFRRFSMSRLPRFLVALDHKVETVQAAPREKRRCGLTRLLKD